LFTTPGIEEKLSGVILYDETIHQSASDGTPFHELLSAKDILVGIKVDQGLEEDPANPNGKVTKGLDGLEKRLQEYKSLSASFAKWRAVAQVNKGAGDMSTLENASRLATYAEICHAKGIVPIIEPEVLIEGSHTAAQAEDALLETLTVVFDAMDAKDIDLKGVILKTSMAVTGKDNPLKAEPKEVAERTMRALVAAAPAKVGGVVFLSGGQSPEEATANLNEIARMEPAPWPVSFSFARALQEPALSAWRGSEENVAEAQSAFSKRLSLVCLAQSGGYAPSMEML
jgi:fructose-bisphosphate aldolase class I